MIVIPLTKEQIKALLNKPRRGGGPRKPKGPDTSVRDYQTWFRLQHRMFDLETNTDVSCDNPNCVDPRPIKTSAMGNSIRTQSCAKVNGVHMCRYCFMSGWMMELTDQMKLKAAGLDPDDED